MKALVASGDELTGVVAMVHGSAADTSDEAVAQYLARIMRGRTPTNSQVADLRRRYKLIGGTTNLLERSQHQVAALAANLGSTYCVRLGAKHSPPFIANAIVELAERGCERVVGIALAPHESLLTTGQYDQQGIDACETAGIDWSMVRSWHLAEDLIAMWADLLSEAISDPANPPQVLFSAHSLPLGEGDPYSVQVAQTAEMVAGEVGLGSQRWRVVYQSVPPGVNKSGWLGPTLDESYPSQGTVVVAPIGFVSDHLEVLYDLDVQARAEAGALGVDLIRTRMPNDDPRLVGALASAVQMAT